MSHVAQSMELIAPLVLIQFAQLVQIQRFWLLTLFLVKHVQRDTELIVIHVTQPIVSLA